MCRLGCMWLRPDYDGMADAPMGADDRSPSMHQGSKRRRSSLASLYNSGGGASDDLGLAGTPTAVSCIASRQPGYNKTLFREGGTVLFSMRWPGRAFRRRDARQLTAG